MTGAMPTLVEQLHRDARGLGYRSVTQERALRALARYLDRPGTRGRCRWRRRLDWASSTSSSDPRNPARRLAAVRGLLRHLSCDGRRHRGSRAGAAGPAGTPDAAARVLRRRDRRPAAAAAGLAPPAGCARTAMSPCSG